MTNEEKKRLHFVDKTDNPDYYLTEYRNDTINSKEWDPVHYIIVDNIKIMGIYQPEKVIPE